MESWWGDAPPPRYIMPAFDLTLHYQTLSGLLRSPSEEMSTGCVRSPPETTEHRLQGQETHYGLPEGREVKMERQKECSSDPVHADEQHHDQEHKKPRRKDTPVLHSPPLIPGVGLMKGETRVIHLEDEEKEGKS